jgi:hypothetical protein
MAEHATMAPREERLVFDEEPGPLIFVLYRKLVYVIF